MKRLLILALLLLIPAAALAQGMSALRVTAIQPSRATFNTGDTLSFNVTVKNGTSAALGSSGYTVFLSVFAGDVCYRLDDPNCHRVWNTQVARTGVINPGASVQVSIPGSVRLSQAADKYCFSATVIDPPNEFGEPFNTCATATCSYQMPQRFTMVQADLVYRLQGKQLTSAPRASVKNVATTQTAAKIQMDKTRLIKAQALQLPFRVTYPTNSQHFQLVGDKIKVTVRFNQDVQRSSVVQRVSFKMRFPKDANATGTMQWINNRELVWTSSKTVPNLCNFTPDCHFDLTVTDAVKNSSSTALDGDANNSAGGTFTHAFTIIG